MSENPYAPPVSNHSPEDLPDAPLPSGWRVDGRMILVRQEAQLPMIDPFDGTSFGTMTLRSISIRHCPLWRSVLMPASAVALVGGGFAADSAGGLIAGAGVVGLLICLVSGFFLTSVRIRVFTSPSSNRKIVASGILVTAFQFVFIVSVIKLTFSSMSSTVLTSVAVLMGVLLVGIITLRFLHRRLKCRVRRGSEFEIHNFHLTAIGYLQQRKSRPDASLTSNSGSPR